MIMRHVNKKIRCNHKDLSLSHSRSLSSHFSHSPSVPLLLRLSLSHTYRAVRLVRLEKAPGAMDVILLMFRSLRKKGRETEGLFSQQLVLHSHDSQAGKTGEGVAEDRCDPVRTKVPEDERERERDRERQTDRERERA
jgi:hypothetical protein